MADLSLDAFLTRFYAFVSVSVAPRTDIQNILIDTMRQSCQNHPWFAKIKLVLQLTSQCDRRQLLSILKQLQPHDDAQLLFLVDAVEGAPLSQGSNAFPSLALISKLVPAPPLSKAPPASAPTPALVPVPAPPPSGVSEPVPAPPSIATPESVPPPTGAPKALPAPPSTAPVLAPSPTVPPSAATTLTITGQAATSAKSTVPSNLVSPTTTPASGASTSAAPAPATTSSPPRSSKRILEESESTEDEVIQLLVDETVELLADGNADPKKRAKTMSSKPWARPPMEDIIEKFSRKAADLASAGQYTNLPIPFDITDACWSAMPSADRIHVLRMLRREGFRNTHHGLWLNYLLGTGLRFLYQRWCITNKNGPKSIAHWSHLHDKMLVQPGDPMVAGMPNIYGLYSSWSQCAIFLSDTFKSCPGLATTNTSATLVQHRNVATMNKMVEDLRASHSIPAIPVASGWSTDKKGFICDGAVYMLIPRTVNDAFAPLVRK